MKEWTEGKERRKKAKSSSMQYSEEWGDIPRYHHPKSSVVQNARIMYYQISPFHSYQPPLPYNSPHFTSVRARYGRVSNTLILRWQNCVIQDSFARNLRRPVAVVRVVDITDRSSRGTGAVKVLVDPQSTIGVCPVIDFARQHHERCRPRDSRGYHVC